ncbi:lipoprotein, putative [Candidatus Koribacter versatilis Ellin345]|uniref:Lipoprotein, putative n=1 Tax=Koribacter versatilis (strain Ellin345) TaxID=204669 RepID=Q1IRY4_KORVE|nr:DUF3443 domain-containing protein [Candidatus Koribacter versatilis]ABF40366.1 lipoprotein, putative [Candidatus Koribacter versatilis Ellin345]
MKRILSLLLLSALLVILAACSSSKSIDNGGGGGGGGTVANSVALSVGPGPSDLTNGGYANILFATVTVCQPGTSNCTAIDHVLVDTGSFGLRIFSSELPSGFTLSPIASGSGSLYECLPFVDSYAWGPVVSADIEMAGEKGSSVPVQLMMNTAAPTTCTSTVAVAGSSQVSTVNDLGAKGILGVGNFGTDCGTYCTTVQKFDLYFGCSSSSASSCTQAATPESNQVVNPVQTFAADNNGVMIQLGSPDSGSGTASGTMFFGVGTQSNNTPASGVTAVKLDSKGDFTTKFQSTTYGSSYADTGSNAYFFGTITNTTTLTTSTGITGCNLGTAANPAYFYCPSSELSESATMAASATPTSTTTVNFKVGNANTTTGFALDDLAGTNTDDTSFDWGLPFFFGRTVFIGFDGASSSLASGSYIAF